MLTVKQVRDVLTNPANGISDSDFVIISYGALCVYRLSDMRSVPKRNDVVYAQQEGQ